MSSYDDGDGASGNDPFVWFESTFDRACVAESFDASRAALATVSDSAMPSVRFVLVKHVDPAGFVFFTNYESRKAKELQANPRAALAFHWASIGEQVRVEGVVARLADEESDAYFASRPRGSQLGAWASTQSAPLEGRSLLEARLAEVGRRFEGKAVSRPISWGGYRLVPSLIEFWRDREDRLHDRYVFTREGRCWSCMRLQP